MTERAMSDKGNSKAKVVFAIPGGVWRPRSVQEEPHVVLRHWRIYEIDGSDLHLAGWCDARGEARVSQRLKCIDATTRRCLSESGRVYELDGPSGMNADVQYVWSRWRLIYAVTEPRDATGEIEAMLLSDSSNSG
jgi:hypothetical protein